MEFIVMVYEWQEVFLEFFDIFVEEVYLLQEVLWFVFDFFLVDFEVRVFGFVVEVVGFCEQSDFWCVECIGFWDGFVRLRGCWVLFDLLFFQVDQWQGWEGVVVEVEFLGCGELWVFDVDVVEVCQVFWSEMVFWEEYLICW